MAIDLSRMWQFTFKLLCIKSVINKRFILGSFFRDFFTSPGLRNGIRNGIDKLFSKYIVIYSTIIHRHQLSDSPMVEISDSNVRGRSQISDCCSNISSQ